MEGYGGGNGKPGYEAELAASEGDAPIKVIPHLAKYMAMLQEVANLQRTQVTIELDDLLVVSH